MIDQYSSGVASQLGVGAAIAASFGVGEKTKTLSITAIDVSASLLVTARLTESKTEVGNATEMSINIDIDALSIKLEGLGSQKLISVATITGRVNVRARNPKDWNNPICANVAGCTISSS